ncbi:hypothetical protein ACP275_05G017200 [Erythranthe tilingii]
MEWGGVFDYKVTFDRFCGNGIVKLWWVCRVLVVLGLISWSPALVPAVFDFSGGFYVEFFSSYAFNPHLVFLFGNSIIALLFVLCRQSDALNLSAGGVGGDFYEHYVRFGEAAEERDPVLPPPLDMVEPSDGGDDEKQIVVRAEEAEAVSESDDVAAAIETAVRQLERFQRTQSEKMKSQISVRPRPELRRSETTTESCRKTGSSSGPVVGVAEIETLSGEEFRRIVDSFIDIHWRKTTTKQNQVEEHDNYRLLKMA